MKKIIYFIACLLAFVPFLKVTAAEKVKVYVFTAGGCPYCESQINYLKSLDSYNKKFIIVEKELYVDHIDWAKGKDYDLGVKVADAFQEHNFSEASASGTPFVIISDIYAATYYNNELEEIINQAYNEKDKDAVACIEKGNDNCISVTLEKIDNNTVTATEKQSVNTGFYYLVSICTFLIIGTYLVKSTIDTNKLCKALDRKDK